MPSQGDTSYTCVLNHTARLIPSDFLLRFTDVRPLFHHYFRDTHRSQVQRPARKLEVIRSEDGSFTQFQPAQLEPYQNHSIARAMQLALHFLWLMNELYPSGMRFGPEIWGQSRRRQFRTIQGNPPRSRQGLFGSCETLDDSIQVVETRSSFRDNGRKFIFAMYPESVIASSRRQHRLGSTRSHQSKRRQK
jgi:hypothetical protein